MLEHQIKEINSPYLKGGLMCPACGFIHGRCGDAVLAFTLLYTEAGDEKYLKAAEDVVDWSENNVLSKQDGLWYNDLSAFWLGTGLFSAMALGETLHCFGDKIPSDIYSKWYKIFIRMAEGALRVVHDKTKFNPVINYYCGASALFALCYKITGEEVYKNEANYWEEKCADKFDENGLLFGECKPHDWVSEKGCHGIDIGYNLEESIQLLLQHAIYMDDNKKLNFYTEKALAHLEFIMPDGAIDNSFGSRHNKWTYWGSRTSDGIQEAFPRLAKYDRRFAKASALNFELYKRCTVDGAFYAGLMQEGNGQPACIHHAFAHSKALALMYHYMDEKDFENLEEVTLPREENYGIKTFQNGYLKLVAVGDYKATISALDVMTENSNRRNNMGGTLNLLWHKKYGAICAATMHTFAMVEPTNFQCLRSATNTYCMTPRIICGEYESDCDLSVDISSTGDANRVEIVVTGNNELNFKMVYNFEGDEVEITITAEKDAVYKLPIIADNKADIKVVSDTVVSFNNMLIVSANVNIKTEDISKRYFNQVGGFEYLPLEIPLEANRITKIKLSIK